MLNSNSDTKSWALSITNYTFGEVSVVYKRTSETILRLIKIIQNILDLGKSDLMQNKIKSSDPER